MAASATVLVDAELHQRAAAKLAAMGLSVDDAVRQMLSSVVEECGVPQSMHQPNAETQAAMQELETGRGRRSSSVEHFLRDLRS